MKKFYLLTKTLLVAVLLCIGASNVWGESTTTSAGAIDNSTPWNHNDGGDPATYYDDWITTYFTLSGNSTYNFTFTTTNTTAANSGWSLFIGKENWSTNLWSTWMVCQGFGGGYWGGGTGTMASSNTYATENPEGAGIQAAMNGATVNLAVTRTSEAITAVATVAPASENAFTMTWTYTYADAEDKTADIYLTFGVEYAYLDLTSVTYTPADYSTGKTVESYDFTGNSTSSGNHCPGGEAVSFDGYSNYILSNATYINMKDRFAGGYASGTSYWYITGKNGGLKNQASNTNKSFAVLCLKAGDYVTITYTNSTRSQPNILFSGSNNITGFESGTYVVSGNTYKITSDGALNLSVGRDVCIKTIVISTSAPVLVTPTISFNSMVANDGLYYPKVTFSSSDDGVTFYDGDGNDITSGYTFTAAGTLTVYAGKSGRISSEKQTYTVTENQVGMILANSVNLSSYTGIIDYSTGKSFSTGRFDDNGNFSTCLIPGLAFSGDQWNKDGSSIYTSKGSRTVSCSVLNENRIATFKHYDYSVDATIFDYLTATNNSVSIKRQGGTSSKNDRLYQYDLYCSPSEEISVTIGSTGYSTFSSPVPLNFAGIDGLTAYVATTVADGAVTLSPVTSAPANTGLVLKGTADKTYSIPVTNSAVTPASNLLVGCIINTTVAIDATSNFNNYVLVNESGTAKFQSLVENGATVTAGKAFLKNGAYSASSARALRIVFAGDITGINEAAATAEAAQKDGKFIENGKLVIVKNGKKFNANGTEIK